MDTLRAMRSFVRAVELGTLSAAAREQGLSQPALSKIVAALEKELNVRLLERSTTRVVPTEQGKRFYERATRVLEEYSEAVADARGQTEKPAGFLRINAPVAPSSSVATPTAAAIRPVLGLALAATISCTTAAPSGPMKRPSSRAICPRAASAPNAQPETAMARIRIGAREKRTADTRATPVANNSTVESTRSSGVRGRLLG